MEDAKNTNMTRRPRPAIPKATVTVDLEQWAKRQIRAEMALRGMRYKQLHTRLEKLGGVETEAQLIRKINRGRFSAAFFLQCLLAMGVTDLKLPEKPSQDG